MFKGIILVNLIKIPLPSNIVARIDHLSNNVTRDWILNSIFAGQFTINLLKTINILFAISLNVKLK